MNHIALKNRCVLVDTVGFIQDLPTDLVHAFRATLEEVRSADLLLHVRDASVSPHVYHTHREAVEETLREIGAQGVPKLEVWNKVDKGKSDAESGPELSTGVKEKNATELRERLNGSDEAGGTIGDMTFPDEVLVKRSPDNPCASSNSGPFAEGAICVSAATGEGLSLLLERVDALLHLDADNRKFAPRPLDRYRYVRVLPGQSQQ